jgi:hypothetical protein
VEWHYYGDCNLLEPYVLVAINFKHVHNVNRYVFCLYIVTIFSISRHFENELDISIIVVFLKSTKNDHVNTKFHA